MASEAAVNVRRCDALPGAIGAEYLTRRQACRFQALAGQDPYIGIMIGLYDKSLGLFLRDASFAATKDEGFERVLLKGDGLAL
jgi:hypothetical protein